LGRAAAQKIVNHEGREGAQRKNKNVFV